MDDLESKNLAGETSELQSYANLFSLFRIPDDENFYKSPHSLGEPIWKIALSYKLTPTHIDGLIGMHLNNFREIVVVNEDLIKYFDIYAPYLKFQFIKVTDNEFILNVIYEERIIFYLDIVRHNLSSRFDSNLVMLDNTLMDHFKEKYLLLGILSVRYKLFNTYR